MNPDVWQQQLNTMALQGLAQARPRELLALAHAMQHDGFTPDLAAVPAAAVREAGYLVDYLAHFGGLSGARRAALRKAVAAYRPAAGDTSSALGDDRLSRAWGVRGELARYLRALLPLQTHAGPRKR